MKEGLTWYALQFDVVIMLHKAHLFYSILSHILGKSSGARGTTNEFATILFHLDLFSVALVELAKSIHVHSLILSSYLFCCRPLLVFLFFVLRRIVFTKPEAKIILVSVS